MDLYCGLDLGTSGVRAMVIDASGTLVAQAETPLPPPQRDGASVTQDAWLWWDGVRTVFEVLAGRVALDRIAALAVDGTSGTLVLTDADGLPLAPGRMYNDASGADAARLVAHHAPPDSAAHGSTSALAKLLTAIDDGEVARDAVHALHQADWIAARFTGVYGLSDEVNALKLGYDNRAREWPAWMDDIGTPRALLPSVLVPGTPFGPVSEAIARSFGFDPGMRVVAGATDSVAAFIATGAREPGDAVTSLGSTLVVKIVSDQPLFAPEYGIYSHRLGRLWLPGGASNTGGAALAQFFDTQAIASLSERIDGYGESGLDYYPLPGRGERFPVADPDKEPVVGPRPDDDAHFLHGLLEGIARVEARAYDRLAELGAPRPRTIRTVGGGATNAAWRRIRQRLIPDAGFLDADHTEAAYGMALLARDGVDAGA